MPKLTELEQKLLRLALDPAAQPGEIANCGKMLVDSFRKRGMTPDEIFGQGQAPSAFSKPDPGITVMPFGRHKGKMLKEIPPNYLEWLGDWLEVAGDRAYGPFLLNAVRAFLTQGGFR
jgi:hypothetical protein